MFIEKNKNLNLDPFNWYNENDDVININDYNTSLLNQYIVEIDEREGIPTFFKWLFSNDFRIYCLDDRRLDNFSMSKVQKKYLEIMKYKNNWVLLKDNTLIYLKEYKRAEDIEFINGSYWFFYKGILDEGDIYSCFKGLNLDNSSFQNLSLIDILHENKELIIGYISWGDSYFKPGTNEEPKALVCYTALNIDSL